jgi:hypothetical protein
VGAVLVLYTITLALPCVAEASGPNPGSLPQTTVEPNFTVGLNAQMRTLWRAIESDSSSLGRTTFFPEGAYLQMKTGSIPDPSADYVSRLIGFFNLDLAAYHRLAASGPRSTLVRVEANRADAAWIPPGVCENKIGYWHVPGVRLVFRKAGVIESVEVASLISWRGIWYVVHLGPNPRPTDVGTVDDFQKGPGTPGPAGGC